MLLSNKVAIITGAAKGIGRNTALKFASEGCDVAIVDISMKAAGEVVREIQEMGRQGLAIECDNTDAAGVQAAVQQVVDQFGKIDILVNSAGGITVGLDATPQTDLTSATLSNVPSVTTIADAEWARVVAVNLTGSFFFCRAVVPHMKEKKYGKIVNVSSIGAISPPGALSHYHAAKAGVIGLTTDMACELAPFGITVNAVMPGPFRTPFYDQILAEKTPEEIEAFFSGLGRSVPMQRIGHPDEAAGAILFLASDLSSYVTGSNLAVAGGLPLITNEASAAIARGEQ